jgi:osmotically-inducible protein OsmY
MYKLTILPLIVFAILSTGCASLAGKATDKPILSSPGLRSAGTVVEDEIIETKILFNLTKGSMALRRSHINVISFNLNVLLIGQAPSQEVALEAQKIAQSTRKVNRVHNEIQIAGPTSFITRAQDTALTIEAKSKLLLSSNAKGLRVKINTEDATVYLMGLVTRSEGEAAVNEIKTISGVRKIVKVFEHID